MTVVLIIGILGAAGGFWITAFLADFDAFRTFLFEHFAVTVGLPCATAGAFVIVSLFRQHEDPIEIKGLGFEIRGAAGPVVLWVLVFLTISVSIKLLW